MALAFASGTTAADSSSLGPAGNQPAEKWQGRFKSKSAAKPHTLTARQVGGFPPVQVVWHASNI